MFLIFHLYQKLFILIFNDCVIANLWTSIKIRESILWLKNIGLLNWDEWKTVTLNPHPKKKKKKELHHTCGINFVIEMKNYNTKPKK